MPSSAPSMSGHAGRAADRDDDAFGGDFTFAELERIWAGEYRALGKPFDTGVFEQLYVDAVEALYFVILGGDECRPVMFAGLRIPAEAVAVGHEAGIFGGLHHHFLRHAADIDAGAAPVTFFGNGDAGAV